ncbi:MAG: DUF4838 domain-containing protein, partial [Armatimonadota bacterium]
AAAQSVTLVTGGEALYQIQLPPDPDPLEQQAADELETYLAKLSGRSSLTKAAETPVTIEIGRAAQNDLLRERAAADQSGFFVEVTGSTVRLAGTTPTATCYAAYDLLEQLGCRWFMPGEIGEVVPRLGQLQLQVDSRVSLPDFKGRFLQALPRGEASDLWALRNKLGGEVFPGAHSWNRLVPPDRYFDTHPEYYALVDGERAPRQLCTSNPMVAAIAAGAIIEEHAANPEKTWFGIGPNDGGGFCECDNCTAQDTGQIDPFSGEVSITDRFLRFANAVAGQVHEIYPEIRFAFYAYHSYMLPPREVMPDPSIVPAIAPIRLCRLHGMGESVCAERNFHQYLITEWTKISPEVYHRGYSYNLAGPNLPLNYVGRWGYEIPYCARNGITGMRIETQMSWANYGPLGYVMAKLMWDTRTDLSALLEDYYDRFYGPAAKPMQLYWMYMDRARRNAPYHTGNAVNIPDIYSARDMEYLSQRLRDATRVTRNAGVYSERVLIATKSWEYLDAFLRMREASESYRWGEARRALDEMREVGRWMHEYDPPLMASGGGISRVERFWAPEVEQGHARTSGGNRMIEGLPDRWRTYMDPNDVGEALRFFSRRVDDSDWQTLRTHSASWSDQGLRYYRGVMWYRQEVQILPMWGGNRVMLWFGGVDESAKVWVNDIYVGEVETNGWTPVELDITHAVRFGRDNLIAVKVTNEKTNELGAGGITRPVMVWSPAGGAEPAPDQPEE